MKKKFLTLVLSLTLCLSSAFIFGACKEKPIPVAEAAAMESFNTAMTNMDNETAVKMSMSLFGVEAKTIISESKIYAYSTDAMEMWITKNENVYEAFTIENISENEIPEYTYSKSIYHAIALDEKSSYDLLMQMGQTNLSGGEDATFEFVSATELNGELTVNLKFTVLEGFELTATFTIKNHVFNSMTINMFGFSMRYNFTYGAEVLNEIPEIPTINKEGDPMIWDECQPKIEISNLENKEFLINEDVSLEDLVLKYYPDEENVFSYYEFTITEEMLQDFTITGFDSSQLTNGTPKEMTISFMGATLIIEYEVVEVVTQE